MGGLIFLGIASSLPELAIVISAAIHHHYDIIIGNLVGGIAIQTLVLVLLDSLLRGKKPLTFRVGSLPLALEGAFVILVTATVMMATHFPGSSHAFGISPVSFAILLLWLISLPIINRARLSLPWHLDPTQGEPGRAHHERRQVENSSFMAARRTFVVGLIFAIAALATLVAGFSLEEVGSQLASKVGIGTGIFAATFMAAVTSLPEISSGIASIKMGDNALAMSDIFGGNIFMLAFFPLADLLAGQPVLPHAGGTDIWLAGLGILVTAVYIVGLIMRPEKRHFRMGADSLAVLSIYVLGILGLAWIR
jgi:cation:H+ antiporter